MGTSPVEAAVGLLLIFVIPGFLTTRALFPEWRLRGDDALLRIVETGALSLLLSVAYTVLLGAFLLNTSGFSASWSDPVLEIGLVAISAVALAAAVLRGGFARVPPAAPRLEPIGGEEGAWELIRAREELARQERRLRHALRTSTDPREIDRLKGEIGELEARVEGLRRDREVELAS